MTWLHQGHINEKTATPKKVPENIWIDKYFNTLKKTFQAFNLKTKQNKRSYFCRRGNQANLRPLFCNAKCQRQWNHLSEVWGRLAMGQEFYNQPGCCLYVKSEAFHEEQVQKIHATTHPSSKNQWKTHPYSKWPERLIKIKSLSMGNLWLTKAIDE